MDYLITNPNKQVFIRLDNNGRPETCSRETAQKFESSKAKNIIDHLPKTQRQKLQLLLTIVSGATSLS